MKGINDEKPEKDTLEEVPTFSDRDPDDYPEVEEEYSTEEETPTEMHSWPRILASLKRKKWSRRSLLLAVLLCAGFGVLLLEVISFMKPEVRKPQIVVKPMRRPIPSIEREEEPTIPGTVGKMEMEEKPSEDATPEEEEPIVSKPTEPSTAIQESEVGKKVFMLGEKEDVKEEKGAKVAGGERKRLEIEGKEEGETQVAVVEESKGRAKPWGKLPTGRYTVNIASFRKRSRAERLMKELEEKGYEAFVEKANIPQKGTWYRVAVGRFSSRGEAQAFARALKEKGINYSFVRKLKEVKQ